MALRQVFRGASHKGWMAHRGVLKRASTYNFESAETRFSQHSKETLHAQVRTSRLKRAKLWTRAKQQVQGQVKGQRCVRTVDYYSATEKTEILSCAMKRRG